MSGVKRRLRGSLTVQHVASLRLDDAATALAWTSGGGMLAVGDRSGSVSIYRVT